MNKMFLLPALLLAFATAGAQEGDSAKTAPSDAQPDAQAGEELSKLKGQLEGLNESYLETKGTVDKLAKIKLSGYVQAQWQYADTNGAASVAGGGFPANANQRFLVRRGRLKTTYTGATSQYVLQFDVTPGGVGIKDAYATLMEPWLKTFSFTMGVFDRPFGYEISYSSSSRESPERSRVFQTLFPGERDMGAKLEINPSADLGFLQYFNVKGGVFTGMGPTTQEYDNEQDFIGRAGFKAPFYDLNLALDGGFSMYLGKATSLNDTAFSVGDTSFIRSTGNLKKTFDREVMGVDAQLYYDLPVIGGLSLRGEYLWGKMPGVSGSSGPYGNAITTAVPAPIAFNREFMGWYVMWVQSLGNKLQGVLKYDVYDPNTQLEGKNVRPIAAPAGVSAAPGAADLAYKTLGLGGVFHWDENLKFTAYYDMVTNEKANQAATGGAAAFKKDRRDNVFTFRAQAKF